MRHRVASKRFNRDTNHRKMMIRNLVRSLVEHGEIVTTEAKAKETKRWADSLISKAKNDSLAVRRQLQQFFGQRDAANTLVEKVAPVFKKRTGGFTSITKLGSRRGDSSEMVRLSLVEQRETRHTLKSHAEHPKKVKKTAPKKKAVSKKAAAAAARKKAQEKISAQKAAASVRSDAQRDEAMPKSAKVTPMAMRKMNQKGQ